MKLKQTVMNFLKKMIILVITLSSIFSNTTQAQKFSEIGLGLGTFLYQGDLTRSIIVMEGFNYSGSLFFRYNFSPALAAKAQVSYGSIGAYDYSVGHRKRNLHFKSHLAEFALTAEIDILPLIMRNRPFGRVSPFLYGGAAVFHFNPKAELNDEWHALQPLATEGQGLAEYPERTPYSLIQISVPFGLDIRYNIDRKFFMGLDLGFRKTFTDYLDDVSTTYVDNDLIEAATGSIAAQLADRRFGNNGPGGQRGDSTHQDWYFLFKVYGTYNIMSKETWRAINRNPF